MRFRVAKDELGQHFAVLECYGPELDWLAYVLALEGRKPQIRQVVNEAIGALIIQERMDNL